MLTFIPKVMPVIRSTKKGLAERLLLNQESTIVKSLLERLEPLLFTLTNLPE